MKNILYLSYDGMTDVLGQSQVLPYLVGLSKEGYKFTILSFEKKDKFLKERATIEAITKQAGITWHPLSFTQKPPVLSKIYDRWKMKRTAKRLDKENNFDLIHCRSYIASEIGLALKKSNNKKWIFDMRGFWADEKVDNGQWDISKALYKNIYHFYKKKETQFLLNADGIVSLTKAAKDHIVQKDAFKNVLIDVIPCCADLAHFDYKKISGQEVEAWRNKLEIPTGKKIISYLGSIGGWYMMEEMFAFYKQLHLLHPEYLFLIITKDEHEKVMNEAIGAGISAENIRIVSSTRNEMPFYLGIVDYGLFFIKPTYSKMASSPTKHAEIMGMGLPVVCNDIGDTGNIIAETGTGIMVNEFNDHAYAEAAKKMEASSFGKADIRNAASSFFDLNEGVRRYLALYKRILN